MFQLQKIFRIIAFSSILSLLFGMTKITTAQIIINEVDADTPGVDSLEFVELYDGGTGNTDLSGLVIVFFNGSDDASYPAFDLALRFAGFIRRCPADSAFSYIVCEHRIVGGTSSPEFTSLYQ